MHVFMDFSSTTNALGYTLGQLRTMESYADGRIAVRSSLSALGSGLRPPPPASNQFISLSAFHMTAIPGGTLN